MIEKNFFHDSTRRLRSPLGISSRAWCKLVFRHAGHHVWTSISEQSDEDWVQDIFSKQRSTRSLHQIAMDHINLLKIAIWCTRNLSCKTFHLWVTCRNQTQRYQIDLLSSVLQPSPLLGDCSQLPWWESSLLRNSQTRSGECRHFNFPMCSLPVWCRDLYAVSGTAIFCLYTELSALKARHWPFSWIERPSRVFRVSSKFLLVINSNLYGGRVFVAWNVRTKISM